MNVTGWMLLDILAAEKWGTLSSGVQFHSKFFNTSFFPRLNQLFMIITNHYLSLRTSFNLTRNSEQRWNFEPSDIISHKGQLEKMLHHLLTVHAAVKSKTKTTDCDYLILFWYTVYSNKKQNTIYSILLRNKIKLIVITSRICLERRWFR